MYRLTDLEHPYDSDCYLSHPARSEDSDDLLIDVANQLGVYKQDLLAWLKSKKSWLFMHSMGKCDIDTTDFLNEFDSLR
jgi:hypothetical protein